MKTAGAPPPAGRRRRRSRQSDPGDGPAPLPLTRIAAVRAERPFADAQHASAWLRSTLADEEALDALVTDAIDLFNRALHAQATAAADPAGRQLLVAEATAVRIGIGSGDEVAEGRYSEAHLIDARGGSSARRRREEALHPQERLAAVLGGRERLDACESLLLRARADLDADRPREAALQLRVGLEALLVELRGALADPDHERDMGEIEARRGEAGEAANAALRGELGPEQETAVTELLAIGERILRRRRILRG